MPASEFERPFVTVTTRALFALGQGTQHLDGLGALARLADEITCWVSESMRK